MWKVSLCMVGLPLLFGVVVGVQADMSDGPWSPAELSRPVVVEHASGDRQKHTPDDFNQFAWSWTSLQDTHYYAVPLDPKGTDSSYRTVKELPPAPDSATLFLYAMATLGAWQPIRFARKSGFAQMTWQFHTSDSYQIGRTDAVHLNLIDISPPCWFDHLSSQPPVLSGYIQPYACSGWNVLFFITTILPRAPPSIPTFIHVVS